MSKITEKLRLKNWESLEVAIAAADRIEELEALTERQVKRTGQLTGEVDKYLRQIAKLEDEKKDSKKQYEYMFRQMVAAGEKINRLEKSLSNIKQAAIKYLRVE